MILPSRREECAVKIRIDLENQADIVRDALEAAEPVRWIACMGHPDFRWEIRHGNLRRLRKPGRLC